MKALLTLVMGLLLGTALFLIDMYVQTDGSDFVIGLLLSFALLPLWEKVDREATHSDPGRWYAIFDGHTQRAKDAMDDVSEEYVRQARNQTRRTAK